MSVARNEKAMTIPAAQHVSRSTPRADSGSSPFSEVRDAAQQRTLAVAASATVGTAVSLTAAVLVALGAVR